MSGVSAIDVYEGHLPDTQTADAAVETRSSEAASQRDAAQVEQGIGKLPIVIFAAGFATYMASIAFFGSYYGVASGLVLLVLGAAVYTCRGIRLQPVPADETAWSAQQIGMSAAAYVLAAEVAEDMADAPDYVVQTPAAVPSVAVRR
jgi:hypothetical protein